jgi:hypothetical protein
VYQRSRGRLPKPSKPLGSSPVASVAVSPEAGSTEGAAVVASAAVGYDAAPSVVLVVRGSHFFFPPVLEETPSFASLTKRSFGSKTTPRREAI